VVLAVMIVTGPAVSSAENFYAAFRVGPGFTQDSLDGAFGFEDTTAYKTGVTLGAAIGYRLPLGLRVEGELGFIHIPVDTEGGVDESGFINNYLLMANAYYDLKLDALGPFKPYVGFGLGVARVNILQDIFRESVGHNVHVNTPRTSFAYQVRAGIAYELTRSWDLTAGYRYVHIDGGQYQRFGVDVGNVGALNNHSLELGVAFKF
jgi:opacity protein-like surface antigen